MSVVDSVIARLAARQHGVVARWQLEALGLTSGSISARIADGRLRRVHRGVYAVGTAPLSAKGRWMAATLAFGEGGALLSHRSAAALWDLRRAGGSLIDVMVAGTGRRRRPGLHVHRTRLLHPAERGVVDEIPVTSLPRTLLDLASVVDARQLQRAFARAERLRIFDAAELRETLDRHPRARGRGLFADLLGTELAGSDDTASELERLFLDLLRDRDLPLPQVNVFVAGYVVDAHWHEHGLVVELDGYESHSDRGVFERDREKLTALQLAGYTVLVFTWRQVTERRDQVARQLARYFAGPPKGRAGQADQAGPPKGKAGQTAISESPRSCAS